uniref:Uncharacterized protein n=1 Tax=Acrobeloides nanus TaxID=290746 RepID=A0A914DBF0_9BILA
MTTRKRPGNQMMIDSWLNKSSVNVSDNAVDCAVVFDSNSASTPKSSESKPSTKLHSIKKKSTLQNSEQTKKPKREVPLDDSWLTNGSDPVDSNNEHKKLVAGKSNDASFIDMKKKTASLETLDAKLKSVLKEQFGFQKFRSQEQKAALSFIIKSMRKSFTHFLELISH